MITCKTLRRLIRIPLRKAAVLMVISTAVVLVNVSLLNNSDRFWTGFDERATERLCGCRRNSVPLLGRLKQASFPQASWCGRESVLRGPGQKVIAYSVYGNLTNEFNRRRYFSMLPVNAEKIAQSYPGWVIRLHHRISGSDPLGTALLCEIYCSFPHVDLCNVTELIHDPLLVGSAGSVNLSYVDRFNPAMWRFLPLFDPQVDLFMARDSDSRIIDREIAAVSQWIQSNYTFHIMRDHPLHNAKILAGMWGAKLAQRRRDIASITEQMLYKGQDSLYGTDQKLLESLLWPFAKYDVMAHDSYRCNNTEYNQIPVYPFPTKREEDRDFIGDVLVTSFRQFIRPCPQACRPEEHQDWEYC